MSNAINIALLLIIDSDLQHAISKVNDSNYRATNCANRRYLLSFRQLLCLRSTSAYRALGVSYIMRYINLLTYLLYCVFETQWEKHIMGHQTQRDGPRIAVASASSWQAQYLLMN